MTRYAYVMGIITGISISVTVISLIFIVNIAEIKARCAC